MRTSIFFSVNLLASLDSAVEAAITEICYRAPMVGTLGAISQAFRRVQPAWKASGVIMLLLPALAHGVEFTIHSLRGTQKLYESVAASIMFSMLTAIGTYFLHRRDVLIVGPGARSFAEDMVRLPVEVFNLLATLLRAPFRKLGDSHADKSRGHHSSHIR